MKDTEVANMLGVPNPAVVTQWRNRHGVRKRAKTLNKTRAESIKV